MKKKDTSKSRARSHRPYPALPFEEVLPLAEAIHQHASGEKVNRLTLLKAINKSPTSSATHALITNSGKYGVTNGSYAADHLELTAEGRLATDKSTPPRERARARFQLAIDGIEPFKAIYDKYKGKKLPSPEVMIDVLNERKFGIEDNKECVDIFVVNAKFIGLLATIAGSETLIPIETVLEELPKSPGQPMTGAFQNTQAESAGAKPKWHKTCFYITPIGNDGTDERKHSDLFLSSLIEPALKGFDLEVVRADKIGEPGMISTQILEHILYSRLVIVDLSFHNPNVFYEMAIRHACKLPLVQLCRKVDSIPFDVNQVRTIQIDTSDIYTLIPKLDTYRSEISSQVRASLEGQIASNPISVFFPGLSVSIPKDKANG